MKENEINKNITKEERHIKEEKEAKLNEIYERKMLSSLKGAYKDKYGEGFLNSRGERFLLDLVMKYEK